MRRNGGIYLLLLFGLTMSAFRAEANEIVIGDITSFQDSSDNMVGDKECKSLLQNSPCTLRAAIEEANGYPGLDPAKDRITIEIPAGVYQLSNASQLNITTTIPITLKGAGAGLSKILPADNYRTLFIEQGAKVNLEGLTFQKNSSVAVKGRGGAIFNSKNAELNIKDSVFLGNLSGGDFGKNQGGVYLVGSQGGAIYNSGLLVIENVSFQKNKILSPTEQNIPIGWNPGEKQVAKDIINQGAAYGGALVNGPGGNATIKRCSFSENESMHGAAVDNYLGETSIENSTFIKNILIPYPPNNPAIYGGVIELYAPTDKVNMANITISEGQDGYAIRVNDGELNVKNSIIKGDCRGTLISQGYNLLYLKNDQCDFVEQNPSTDLIGDNQGAENPLLGYLWSYNITEAYPLDTGSPAIDGGDPAGCTEVDQSGFSRPKPGQGRCDIGAVESGCGNSIKESTEDCDDGNFDDSDGCDHNCTFPSCGNAVVDVGEECDFGDLIDGDGCDHLCRVEGSGGSGNTTGSEVSGGGSESENVDSASGSCSLQQGVKIAGYSQNGFGFVFLLLVVMILRKKSTRFGEDQ